MESLVRRVWAQETGRKLKPASKLPEGLGRFELGAEDFSIALALQQIAPYARAGGPLPASVPVPFVRRNGHADGNGHAATPTRGREIPAPHRVRCRVCGEWIEPGEPARVHSRGPEKRRWRHAAC